MSSYQKFMSPSHAQSTRHLRAVVRGTIIVLVPPSPCSRLPHSPPGQTLESTVVAQPGGQVQVVCQSLVDTFKQFVTALWKSFLQFFVALWTLIGTLSEPGGQVKEVCQSHLHLLETVRTPIRAQFATILPNYRFHPDLPVQLKKSGWLYIQLLVGSTHSSRMFKSAESFRGFPRTFQDFILIFPGLSQDFLRTFQ